LFLVHFVHRHLDFRLPEFDTLLEMHGLSVSQCYDRELVNLDSPFLVVELPSEEIAAAVCSRAILIKRMLELWGKGLTVEACSQAVQSYPDDVKSKFYGPDTSWSVNVEGFNVSLPMNAQHDIRNYFRHLAFEGPVQCRNPNQRFWIYCEYDIKSQDEDFDKRTPLQVLMGREVSRSSRKLVSQNDLKKRKYLGPTSMDNELSLIMANMAKVVPGSLVFDPFAGTGSILVACSQFGAFCTGTDIDIRVLRGKNGLDVNANFRQYGLPIPELIRSDNSVYRRHFREQAIWDAIVCDPPYGIRAGARRSGSKREEVQPVPIEKRRSHIPQTQPYAVEQVMYDLMKVAAATLKVGARLCYLLPCTYDLEEKDLPTHPCLLLRHNSLEKMTMKMGRRLITMEKVRQYDYSKEEEYESQIFCGLEKEQLRDLPFANLREKVQKQNSANKKSAK